MPHPDADVPPWFVTVVQFAGSVRAGRATVSVSQGGAVVATAIWDTRGIEADLRDEEAGLLLLSEIARTVATVRAVASVPGEGPWDRKTHGPRTEGTATDPGSVGYSQNAETGGGHGGKTGGEYRGGEEYRTAKEGSNDLGGGGTWRNWGPWLEKGNRGAGSEDGLNFHPMLVHLAGELSRSGRQLRLHIGSEPVVTLGARDPKDGGWTPPFLGIEGLRIHGGWTTLRRLHRLWNAIRMDPGGP